MRTCEIRLLRRDNVYMFLSSLLGQTSSEKLGLPVGWFADHMDIVEYMTK